MPAFLILLIEWLMAAIASIAAFIVTYITKRLALTAIAIGVMITLTTALWAGLKLLLSGIAVAMPAGVTVAAGWIMPGNIAACASVLIAAKVARFVYDFKVNATKMRAS